MKVGLSLRWAEIADRPPVAAQQFAHGSPRTYPRQDLVFFFCCAIHVASVVSARTFTRLLPLQIFCQVKRTDPLAATGEACSSDVILVNTPG